MAYGHAQRTLDAIRMLVAETRELLSDELDLDAEQEQWLREEGGCPCQACTVPAQRRPAAPPSRKMY